MSKITTSPLFLSPVKMRVKQKARFTILLPVTAEGVTLTGITGRGVIASADGTVLWDSGVVSGTVLALGSAQLLFDAPEATTGTWAPGVYYFDAYWKVGSTQGPVRTMTYELTVGKGPTP